MWPHRSRWSETLKAGNFILLRTAAIKFLEGTPRRPARSRPIRWWRERRRFQEAHGARGCEATFWQVGPVAGHVARRSRNGKVMFQLCCLLRVCCPEDAKKSKIHERKKKSNTGKVDVIKNAGVSTERMRSNKILLKREREREREGVCVSKKEGHTHRKLRA